MTELDELESLSGRESSKDNEGALALMLVTSLLRHHKESKANRPHTVPAFEAVAPHFWLAMARGIAALSEKEHEGKPDADWRPFSVAQDWLRRAIRGAPNDPAILHAASDVLFNFAQKELIVLQEEDGDEERWEATGKVLREAFDYLAHADQLSPCRPDILFDLGEILTHRSYCVEGQERRSLLMEALRYFEEAANLLQGVTLGKTGESHPSYTLAVVNSGTAAWLAASATDETGEKRKLLEVAHRQLREALKREGWDVPSTHMMIGQTALDLAWLPGSPRPRRELFKEACERFTFVLEADRQDYLAHSGLGSALVGRAALASGAGQRAFLTEAEEYFEEMARLFPEMSEPHLEACKAWLRLAVETSGEVAREGANRAAETARRANLIKANSGDYLLACALSQLGEISEAAELLVAALGSDPAEVQDALRDPHLDPLWKAKPALREALDTGSRPGSVEPSP